MEFLKSWFNRPPSKDQFAKALLAEFRRAGDRREFRYDQANFQLTHSDGEMINLSNLYQEHCQLPQDQRAAHLQRVVQATQAGQDDLPESFEAARPHLRPKIWLRAAIVNIDLRMRLAGKERFDCPTYPLGEHLVSTIVYDLPSAMRSLSQSDFNGWGVSYYEALEAACENLLETSIGYSKIGDRFYSDISGDNYDSSRILLKDRIQSWDVLGDHVAIVAQRDALYVTGSKDDTGLKIMLELTEATLRDQPRPLSPIPLRLVDGEWEDWMLPKTHELFPRYQQLQTEFIGNLYAEQKELLEAIFEKEQSGPFVASFSAIQKKTSNDLLSYCVWGDGVDSLLPKTQLIFLANQQGPAAVGEWGHVASVVGNLMEADDSYYPIRYRVRQFPNTSQLVAIGKLDL